jgi:hypothetical protein
MCDRGGCQDGHHDNTGSSARRCFESEDAPLGFGPVAIELGIARWSFT